MTIRSEHGNCSRKNDAVIPAKAGIQRFVAVITLLLLTSVTAAFADDPTMCEKAKGELAAANAYAAQGETDKAVDEYRKVTTEYPACRAQAAEAQIHIGEVFQNKKMCMEAAAAFEAVVANYKDQPDFCLAALGKMGRTYRAAGKLNEALASFKRIVSGYQSRPQACADAMLGRAEIFEEAGSFRKAETECRDLLEHYNTNPLLKGQCRAAHYKIACLMKAAGRPDEALAAFAGIKPNPDDAYAATALLKRGQIFASQQRHEEAIAEFHSLLDKYPQHRNTCLQARFLMAGSLLFTSDQAGASKIIKEVADGEAIESYPNLYYDLMSLQRRCGDPGWRDSGKKYADYKSRSSDSGQADFPPVEIAYYYEGDLPKAEKLAAEFVAKHPSHALAPEAEFIQGSCLLSLGDKKRALAVFDGLVASYGKVPSARHYTGLALRASADILAELGRANEAVQRLRRLVASNPTESAAKLDAIGRVYTGTRNWAEAAQAFRKEAEVNKVPDDTVCGALYSLGDCCYQMGDVSSARQSLLEIIDRSPDSLWARKARGLLYMWAKKSAQ